MVTVRNAAIEAENRPVYNIPVLGTKKSGCHYEDSQHEDPISIFLPALGHLIILFLCSLGVHREDRPGAVTKVGVLQWLIWR